MPTMFSTACRRGSFRRVLSLCLPLLLLPLAAARSQVNVLTYQNDNARTGQNLAETALTPANVTAASFGKLYSLPVDGYVYAQPLYVSHVNIGGTFHNLLLIATEHDSVYAFDADNMAGTNAAPAAPLWQTSFLNAAAGVTTVNNNDTGTGDIKPEIGITGTPVIGLGAPDISGGTTGSLYVVAKTKENGAYFQRLHALDLATGLDRIAPTVIAATVPGTGDGKGEVAFNALVENQRSGLVLSGNVLYLAFASHGDNGAYHGWVLAYNPTTLAQLGAYNTTPNGSEGGIWMSGAAPAADNSGNLFYITGNGSFNANTKGTEYGMSFQKLSSTLFVQDYFSDKAEMVNNGSDQDQGSGGVMLLPDSAGNPLHPHLLVGCGKSGNMFLLDRDNLGGFNLSTDNVVQQISIKGAWSNPAFWNGSIYYQASGQYTQDSLKQFSVTSGALSSTAVSESSDVSTFPGSTPTISASGTTNGIVWTINSSAYNNGSPILYAHDATNVSIELYDSTQNTLRDRPAGNAVKFSVPTVANGRVYFGAQYNVNVYGLLKAQPTPIISSSGSGKVGDTVTLTEALSGTALYYTTDGTTPTQASILYTAPFVVTAPETITVVSFASGYAPSSAASRYFGAAPIAPIVTATPGDTKVMLSWPVSAGATGYNVKRSTVNGGPYATLPSGANITASSYTDAGLTNGTTYYYVVSAVNPYGESANSAQTAATPTAPSSVPPAPTKLAAVAGSSQVTLTWNAAASAAGYKIYRGTSAGAEATAPLASGITGTTYTDAAIVSGTTYYYKVTAANSVGEGPASNEASATPTAPTTVTLINYPTFTGATGLQLNGTATLSGSRLRLTDGGSYEAASAFYATKVSAQNFTDSFQVQMTNPQADGFTVCLQAGAPTALGANGGSLGYQNIPSSVAVKFDLFSNIGEGVNSTGLYMNGAIPTTPAIDLTPSGLNLHSGNILSIVLSYDGTTLTVKETDTVTGATATQTYLLNLAATVGSSQVYAGFTGGTGGLSVTTDILNWTYTVTNAVPTVLTTIAVTPATAAVTAGSTQAFSATGYDQYGTALSPQPVFAWSVDSGGAGSINGSSGLFTAGSVSGTATVRATSGAISGLATVTITGPPSSPTGLTATAYSPNEIDLAWTNTSSSQTGLKLIRTVGGVSTTFTLAGTATTYADTGLSPQTAYTYTLAAVGPGGTSAPAGPVSATTPNAPPTQASNLTATVLSPTQIHLTWTDNSNNETGFNIYRKTGTAGFFSLITTAPASPGVGGTVSYNDTGLIPGTYYEYHLKAVNAIGEAGDFAGTNTTTWASAPTALTAVPGSGQVTLSWTPPTGAVTSYTVTYGLASGAETTAVAGITGTSTTLTGLTLGKTYYFLVSAVNAGGTGPASNEASATLTATTAVTLINYPTFTGATGLQLNGAAALSGSRLRLTNGRVYEAASAFYATKVSAQNFTDSFQVQMTNPQADGFTVCLQAAAPTALGIYGAGLSYQNIPKSVAVKFDLYSNSGEGVNSTGLYVNGAIPTRPATSLTPSGLNLHSGNILSIVLSYNGTTLTVKETDTVTGATATQTYPLNLAATVGSTQVYAGFTGATGGLGVTTDILNWTYTTPPAPGP